MWHTLENTVTMFTFKRNIWKHDCFAPATILVFAKQLDDQIIHSRQEKCVLSFETHIFYFPGQCINQGICFISLFKLSHSAPKNVGQSHRIVCHCEIQKEVQKSRMRDFWMALHSQGYFSSFLRRFDMKHEKLLYAHIFPISSYSFKEDWMLVLSQVLWNVGVHFILL